MQTLPEIMVGGARKRSQSPHEFVQSQGVGVPTGETADDGTRSLLRSEADFLPWAGTQSALGLMPSGDKAGGLEPSLYDNLKNSRWSDAFSQAVGIVPEVGPAAVKGALGLGALYKAMTAARPEIGAAMDPSLMRGFTVADPADLKTRRALDMFHDGRSFNDIHRETSLIPNTTGEQAFAEHSDAGVRFKPEVEHAFKMGVTDFSGPIGDMIDHPELQARLPGIFKADLRMVKSPSAGGSFNAGTNNVLSEAPRLYPKTANDVENHISNIIHELSGHSALFNSKTKVIDQGVHGPKGVLLNSGASSALGRLAEAIRNYNNGDTSALFVSSAPEEIAARYLSPNDTYTDFIKGGHASSALTPDIQENLLRLHGVNEGGSIGDVARQFTAGGAANAYYRNQQEALSFLSEMRRDMPPGERAVVMPYATPGKHPFAQVEASKLLHPNGLYEVSPALETLLRQLRPMVEPYN